MKKVTKLSNKEFNALKRELRDSGIAGYARISVRDERRAPQIEKRCLDSLDQKRLLKRAKMQNTIHAKKMESHCTDRMKKATKSYRPKKTW